MDNYDVRAKWIPYEYQPFRSPRHAQGSKRYIEVKGFAWFNCPQRHHRWASAHAWCFIDLKTRTICYTYKQSCRKCDNKAKPEYTEDSFERMADYAVEMYLRKIGRWESSSGSSDDDSDYSGDSDCSTRTTTGGPHDQDRCGKCRALGYRCCN